MSKKLVPQDRKRVLKEHLGNEYCIKWQERWDTCPTNFTNSSFEELEKERRNLIKKALRNIISQALDDDESKGLVIPDIHDNFSTLSITDTTGQSSLDLGVASAKDKSELNKDGDGDYCIIDIYEGQDDEKPIPPSNRNTHDVHLKVMCQYLALFSSTKIPARYLVALPLDKNTCLIKNHNSVPNSFKYRKFNDIWYQVGLENINYFVQPLKKQLDQGPRVTLF
ncbi:uncharacterized protein LOC126835949 [Adelges cooleyi]|uniref:uncharacterized protein LOC126835949 n=1 Tax=Adelges cooleyi TaxID=133065 RepID=UPI00217F60BC|nr:uncharacterized protein LOC126835949 [Adelges cooleyi]